MSGDSESDGRGVLSELILRLKTEGESLSSVVNRAQRLLDIFAEEISEELNTHLREKYGKLHSILTGHLKHISSKHAQSQFLPFFNKAAKLAVKRQEQILRVASIDYRLESAVAKRRGVEALKNLVKSADILLSSQPLDAQTQVDSASCQALSKRIASISDLLIFDYHPACALKDLTSILNDTMVKETITTFRDTLAVEVLDSFEEILGLLDHSSPLRQRLIRLSSRLASASRQMPTRSVLPGVVIDQRAWPASGGGFADVFKVIYKGRNVAVKRLRFFAYPPSKEAELDGALCKEAIIWKHLEHPFVLPFMGVCILDPETGFKSTVSPWCDLGNLGRHLAGNKPLDVGKTLLQIAMGIEYLHSQNVVHGDISGNNVLLTDNLDVQICDFGLGKWQETSIVTGGSRATPGTVRYTAPELHRGERPTYASDVYAFACLALEICTRKVPFSGTETMGVASRVCRGDRPPCPEEILDQRLWDLIEECWSHQPDERPSTARVVATIQGWGVYLPECGSVSQE